MNQEQTEEAALMLLFKEQGWSGIAGTVGPGRPSAGFPLTHGALLIVWAVLSLLDCLFFISMGQSYKDTATRFRLNIKFKGGIHYHFHY